MPPSRGLCSQEHNLLWVRHSHDRPWLAAETQRFPVGGAGSPSVGYGAPPRRQTHFVNNILKIGWKSDILVAVYTHNSDLISNVAAYGKSCYPSRLYKISHLSGNHSHIIITFRGRRSKLANGARWRICISVNNYHYFAYIGVPHMSRRAHSTYQRVKAWSASVNEVLSP